LEFLLFWFISAAIVGFAGLNRKGGFLKAFAIGLIFSPLVALIVVIGSAHKNPIGCGHCENRLNEAEFCGLCGKNEAGLTRDEFKERTA
jgi:hypothetical protein